MNPSESCRTFHTNTKEYTFCVALHKTFSKTDNTLGKKASLNRYKKIVITPGFLSNHHRSKLDFNSKEQVKVYKVMETKYISSKWLLGQSRDKDRNEWIPGIQYKYRHNIKNIWDTRELGTKENFIALSAFKKKAERFHTSNLTVPLKRTKRSKHTEEE